MTRLSLAAESDHSRASAAAGFAGGFERECEGLAIVNQDPVPKDLGLHLDGRTLLRVGGDVE